MGHYDVWCDYCGEEIGWSGLSGRCCDKSREIAANNKREYEKRVEAKNKSVKEAHRILDAYNVSYNGENVSIFDVVELIKNLA